MRRIFKNEDGAVTVIVAAFLAVMFGMMALSVDRGSWLSEKRKYQNAVDAGALTAATELIKNGAAEDDARNEVISAMNKNDITVDPSVDELTITRDGGNVTVTLTKDADSYFGTALNGKTKQPITVSATAGTEQKIKHNHHTKVDLPINAAIESGRDFTWAGSAAGPVVTGDITTGGALTITSPVTINGSVSADGDLTIKPYGPTTINGSLLSGGSTYVTNPIAVSGNLESKKNIVWQTTAGSIQGSVSANGETFLGVVSIGGSVNSKGRIYFNDSNASVGGDVRSNTQTAINGGAIVRVDGTFYQKGSLFDYQIANTKTSSGAPANFVDDNGTAAVGTVTHKDYEWKWDKLYAVKDNSLTITQDLYNAYIQEKCDGQSWKAQINYSGGNIEFKQDADFQGFFDFCHRKAGVDMSMPSYIPGSITVNMGAVTVPYSGCLIVENDITMNSQVRMKGSGACLMSMNGNVTVGNWGEGTELDGTIVLMNREKTLKLNNGGKIHGGVISHGEIIMNGKWMIDASDNWKSAIPSIDEEESESTVITNIRLIK